MCFESNKQTEMLVPLIEECLCQAKIWYQDLNLIAFTNGPGSFTGVRIGYSCAKALQISTNLPIIALSSLEVIAYPLLQTKHDNLKKILVVNDAKLSEFYIQDFNFSDKLVATYEPHLIAVDKIKEFFPKENFLLAGSAKLLIKELPKNCTILDGEDFISAKNIALLAKDNYQNQDDVKNAPLYIRKPKISKRKDLIQLDPVS
jgi:tRNA threonylcarbamoyladenosine biosynthesis protein TsaB